MEYLKGKRVLVLGGTGFIGYNLLQRLSQHDCEIWATYSNLIPNSWHRKLLSNVAWKHVELRDQECCDVLTRNHDVVFMCAAETSGAAVMASNPLSHVTPNIVMNAQVLESAYRNGVKHFVFISSSTVYHDTGETPTAEYHLRYDRPPHSSYYLVGWMKRYSEILCYSYAKAVKEPMKVTVVRPGNIYGPWGKFNPETSHMTAAMVRRVAERQDPVEVWGTGDDVRDLMYIGDFITGLLAATAHTEDYFVVNLASGVGYTVNDVLYTLLGLEDYNPKVLYDPTKPSTIPVRLLDTDRMRYVLGFQPTMTLAEGLDRTLSWYKENRDTWTR